MRAAVRVATVLVLVLSLGLHWALLQTVAWTGMMISYSRDGSLAEAVSKTFDGEHPCRLCHAIQKGRADEQKQDQPCAKPISKLDCGLVWQAVAFNFDCSREPIDSPDVFPPSRSDAPPKPRPRCSSSDNVA